MLRSFHKQVVSDVRAAHLGQSLAASSVHCSKRTRLTSARAQDDEGEAPDVQGDWRAFRARLIANSSVGSRPASQGAQFSQQNLQLLREQNEVYAKEGVWAHPTEASEVGGLLLATRNAPSLLGHPQFWQVVILLLEHGSSGSSGIILNRPAAPRLGDILTRLPGLQGDALVMQEAFSDSTIYHGGFYAPNKIMRQSMTMLHGHKELEGCREITHGIYIGGERRAAEAVQAGVLRSQDFRFFAGAMTWGPRQLALEVASGVWHTAACSRSLALKQCLRLPTPLWREIMELMGGEFLQAARSEI